MRDQLTGPSNDGTLHNVLPTERYPCGALYPTSPWGDGIDPAVDDPDADPAPLPGVVGADDAQNEPAVIRRYVPPSSLGFSLFIRGSDIRFQVLCSGARYERSSDHDERGRFKNDWTRRSMVTDPDGEVLNVKCPGKEQSQNVLIWSDRARVDIRWRRFVDGWIVTVSLCNAQVVADQQTGHAYVIERAAKSIFEARLRCVIDAGEVGVYPHVDRSLLDAEEQEIELKYASRHIHAIGHGCAADWLLRGGNVAEIRSNTMPSVEVAQMTADTGGATGSVLSLVHLAAIDTAERGRIGPELATFVDNYGAWVAAQRKALAKVAHDDEPAGERIVARMQTAIKRMRQGLARIENDDHARIAFAVANRAMLDQMRQLGSLRGKAVADDAFRWRPFQLAFLLSVLESACDEDNEFRDTVDLIWFPTGGGKTEAYLGLVAFQIALRRLTYPDAGGGTTVLMRYTLRLLTRDQFLRATRLICALELIRRQRKDLGAEPISIGLWVGNATSPNTFQQAGELLQKARTGQTRPALVIDQCPWCNQPLDLQRGFLSTPREFHFACHNPDCEFGRSEATVLPCNIVDEALYDSPPTMLVATVDKFARLTWDERASAFFGGNRNRPPELVIQDELHLIAGALGSIAGIYEAALDTVIQLRGIVPKYIASTATIRMADQQVRRLYARDCAVFPPPGLDCDDSYFARSTPITQKPGRLYVGYLAPLLNRQRCMAPLAAALLAAPQVLFAHDQNARDLLDAWWTQVVYHGSLKGVGNSHTAFQRDVRDFMQLMHVTDDAPTEQSVRDTPRVGQLTSLSTAEENAETFARLTKHRGDDGCLDAALATNMISVGLDVDRLSLMVINGQPLTTAEYIQASSRVGRSKVPGIVYMNYYRDQARSLSHYESFRPYHDAFYRFVEPTSVTPHTYQARLRALHAAWVIVIRHGQTGLCGNGSAGRFDSANVRVRDAAQRLKQRCELAITNGTQATGAPARQDVREHIDLLMAQWQAEVERCRQARRGLQYQVSATDTGFDRLLYTHGDRIHGLWPTLHSMRNVEDTAVLKVL
ncbi:MAG: hypothetical protein J0H50_13780 [Xanthomonadales bacterium]|nr:hypothetical protein [Xanthomonadales bacterium]